MSIIFGIYLAVISSLVVTACVTSETTKPAETLSSGGLPEWISNPGAFASGVCVVASNSMSVDREEALDDAQINLAKQIEDRIKSVDSKDMEKNGSVTSGRFSVHSKVIVDTSVREARIQRQDYVNVGGVNQFCVQVAISESERAPLLDKVIQASGVHIAELNKKDLYAAFMQ